ncbi:cobalamin adenosyltransferase [Desulfosporosinus sp. HMP52]|uniref:phosphate propanoyltransferase n=1 Tax=Desulfosporosinus sp. HMP52 TaxID=1487923 RepID=UPI00051FCE60|nr:phosphate propanoyltransferase [Desulfosporosinus sp. HMP52]KGK83236.1 cobalamin adenosyltransferase [Desulfosporosinus sp. HMP52]
MIVTEYELRANWHKNKEKLIILPPGSVITPSARDFIRSKGIDVQIEGNGLQDLHKTTFSTAAQSLSRGHQSKTEAFQTRQGTLTQAQTTKVTNTGAKASGTTNSTATIAPTTTAATPGGGKPEHMTHLRPGVLVTKTHPVIAYRGQLDLFQCELAEVQCVFHQAGEAKLIEHLDEISALCRQLMVSEVKQEPFQWTSLLGFTSDELRERSHHPKKYYGIDHSPLSYTHGPIVAKLHQLRAKSREVELYANRAFTDDNGTCSRTDLIQALNRLSSTFYILACEVRSRTTKEGQQEGQNYCLNKDQTQCQNCVPVGTSNRHIHLSQPDLEALFGQHYALTVQKDLSQPGQFAAVETVTLIGPKGRLEKVRVLGPVRKSTQVEISVTDCFKLGVKPVIRDSGQHEGTPGLRIEGPAGRVELTSGVMVASRHIHLHTQDAQEWSLKDGDRVCVKVESPRPITYEDVLIRVSDQYHKELHLDLDEANAALIESTSQGILMGV